MSLSPALRKNSKGGISPRNLSESFLPIHQTDLDHAATHHSEFHLAESTFSANNGGADGKKERLLSLDAFRGLVILVMILVDDAGPTYGGHIDHSPWDSVTLADFVMPSFLFIVGTSMVLAMDGQNKEGNRWSLLWTCFLRVVRMFVIGLVLQGGQNFGGAYDLSILRIPGILQRIGFAYLIVTCFELALNTRDVGFVDEEYFRYYSKYAWH